MELVPANAPLSFEVTFDSPSLYVGMSIYNNTGGSPVLIGGVRPMTHLVGNTYQAKFTADAGLTYVVFKAVYTDNTYTTLDPTYSQGSESFTAENVGSPIQGGMVIGFVEANNELIGLVDC